jgi:hypothetical protein
MNNRMVRGSAFFDGFFLFSLFHVFLFKRFV